MARIKLKFHDKTYIIEYANRIEVKQYFGQLTKIKSKKKDDIESGVKQLVLLIKAGLVEHHKDDMPSNEEIERWATSMPDAKKFFDKLMSMVQEVVSLIDDDTKNLSWEVEN